jgi:hypothetical protein
MPPAAPPKPLPSKFIIVFFSLDYTSFLILSEPKVAEKPAPTTPDKADVGNIRAR